MRIRIYAFKLIYLIILSAVTFTGITNAQFLDEVIVTGNSLLASDIDFLLTSNVKSKSNGFFLDIHKFKKDEPVEKSIRLESIGSASFSYYPFFIYKAGDINVCNKLKLTMDIDSGTFFEGSLTDLGKSADPVKLSGTNDLIKFQIESVVDDVSYQGKYCKFDFEFKTFKDESMRIGFYDEENLSNYIKIAYEPEIAAFYDRLTHQFVITLSNLTHINSYNYILSYKTDTISDLVKGSEVVSGSEPITKKILTGSCSEFGTCVYHPNPREFMLEINFIDLDSDIQSLFLKLE